MKMKFTYMMAAIAAVVAVSSCTKSTFVGEGGGTAVEEGGERVITASFGPATKSYLDDDDKFTPKFSDGDLILISNGSEKESCRIFVTNGNAVFYTRMTGTLKAVYPESAAVTSGNDITDIKVPSTQTGLFKDANIAMAENITTEAVFKNKTSILTFYVDKSIGVKRITVAGTSAVASGGETTIDVDPDGDALISTVTTGNILDPRLCYVSILPGSNTLTFTSETNTQGTVEKHTSAVNFAINTIYKAFLPYYIEVKVSGSDWPEVYQRWSYCNLGAFLPEEEGLFFSWADIVGHKHISINTFENDYQFTKENCKYYEETVSGVDKYSKYNSSDGLTVLEPEDDAATCILGEGWRMPTAGDAYTTGDFYTLKSATYWGFSDIIGRRGVYVFDISDAPGKTAGTSGSLDGLDTSKAKLYFPYTGRTDDYSHYVDALGGYYWSSTAFSSYYYASAYHLKFSSTSSLELTYSSRYYGMPIRPIAVSPRGVEFDPLDDKGEY